MPLNAVHTTPYAARVCSVWSKLSGYMNYYIGMSRNLIRERGATTKEMFGSQIVSLLISTITTRPVSTILRPILACDWVFYEVERSKRLDSGQMILRGDSRAVILYKCKLFHGVYLLFQPNHIQGSRKWAWMNACYYLSRHRVGHSHGIRAIPLDHAAWHNPLSDGIKNS